MAKSVTHYKPFILLGLFLLSWWVLPGAVKSVMRVGFFEMQAPAWVGLSSLKDLQLYWSLRAHSKHELIEAGRDLARLNAAYELTLQENAQLRYDIAELEAFFDLPSVDGYRYEVARISKRDIGAWWQQMIIRKGSYHGLREGMGVVFSGGVVGRIADVYAYTATVELVSSPNFRIAAHFEGDNRPVTYQGALPKPFYGAPEGAVSQVPLDMSEEAEHLVTSKLGGTYPDGLSIGWVPHLESGLDGLFASGAVALDPRLMELEEVAVLIPLES